ncbi:MAG: DUF1572 family protein [Bryobacteraceae bacterium]|nr:DUF1572 family protein [Bryobacteraceae bacterium]
MHEIFLRFSIDKLKQLAGRIDTCLTQLDEQQIWWRGGDESNSVGNLVLHLRGNLGQWILTAVAGAPDTRRRDDEFNAIGGVDSKELRRLLAERVDETVVVFESLTSEQLLDHVQVQSYDVTVLEAVYHVVEHFAQHAAQIMYATKLLTHSDLGFYGHLKSATHSETTP